MGAVPQRYLRFAVDVPREMLILELTNRAAGTHKENEMNTRFSNPTFAAGSSSYSTTCLYRDIEINRTARPGNVIYTIGILAFRSLAKARRHVDRQLDAI